MDFYVTLPAKNAVMSYANTIVPAVFGIGGVLIGLLWNGRRERRKQWQEIQNIKLMLLQELRWNCKELMKLSPFHPLALSSTIAPREVLTAGLCSLSFLIYEKYLDKLYRLSAEETKSVYETYFWIQHYAEHGREAFERDIGDEHPVSTGIRDLSLVRRCSSMQLRVFSTIVLLEHGVEGIYKLMDEEAQRPFIEGEVLRDPYLQWYNTYASDYHHQSVRYRAEYEEN